MSGFDNDVMFADNVDFTGGFPVQPRMIANGQLLIGADSDPQIRVNNLTSSDGSITITNGPGTIDLAGATQGWRPNAVVQIFDDFIPNNRQAGQLTWRGSYTQELSSDGHPGIISYTDLFYLEGGLTPFAGIEIGDGDAWFNFVIDLQQLSNGTDRYYSIIGLNDINLDSPVTNGLYFYYEDDVNSGNWVINSAQNTTVTSVNTSIAASTGFHTYSIHVYNSGASVDFFIDNVQAGTTITTNIPTSPSNQVFPNVYRGSVLGSPLKHLFDLFYMSIGLDNPRPGPEFDPVSPSGLLNQTYRQVSGDAQILGTDCIVGEANTAAAYTLTMPASLVPGQVWILKDESGGASGNNITISGNGNNIDGAATYPITTDYGSVTIYASNSQYHIV